MAELYRYGVSDTVLFPLIKRASVDYATTGDYTPAASDVVITKDGASQSYAVNAVAIATGTTWMLTLEATELNAKKIVVTLIDAPTKAVEDQAILIHTFGSPLAQMPFDWSINTVTVATINEAAKGELVNTIWATPNRSLSDWAAIVNAVWATGSRTLTSFGTLQGDIANTVWATPSRSLTDWDGIVNAVWATPSRTLSGFGTLQGDVVNAVWATPSRTLSSIDNVKGSLVSSVWATPTRTLSAGVTVAVGGIDSTSFAAGAVDAAALAQDAAQEVADEVLNRNLAGGGSGGARIVRDALRVLRNKVDLAAATVYQEDDNTPAWTFTTTSDALATRIVGVDPA